MKSSITEKGENMEEKKSTIEASALLLGDEDLESILRLKSFGKSDKVSRRAQNV